MDHLLSKELFYWAAVAANGPQLWVAHTLFDGGLVVEWASVLLPPCYGNSG